MPLHGSGSTKHRFCYRTTPGSATAWLLRLLFLSRFWFGLRTARSRCAIYFPYRTCYPTHFALLRMVSCTGLPLRHGCIQHQHTVPALPGTWFGSVRLLHGLRCPTAVRARVHTAHGSHALCCTPHTYGYRLPGCTPPYAGVGCRSWFAPLPTLRIRAHLVLLVAVYAPLLPLPRTTTATAAAGFAWVHRHCRDALRLRAAAAGPYMRFLKAFPSRCHLVRVLRYLLYHHARTACELACTLLYGTCTTATRFCALTTTAVWHTFRRHLAAAPLHRHRTYPPGAR